VAESVCRVCDRLKAYDSDELDEQLAERGVELIAPHHANRKLENVTQDRRPLRRYRRRWTVERSMAWIQNFHRLCIRWEKSTNLFQGFLHLGCTLPLLSRLLKIARFQRRSLDFQFFGGWVHGFYGT
jgi:hypothetical protein